jgi:hypothetical protein
LVALAVIATPVAALADGDPASDVLAAQRVYLPADAGASLRQQAELDAVTQAAARAGYPVRVAVIAGPSDLGSVAALWRRPQSYADYLGQELSLVFGGRVLVVMPDGLGLYRSGRSAAAERIALADRPAPGRALAVAVLGALQRLTSATGHRLPSADFASPPAAAGSRPGGITIASIVLIAGAAVIVAAWSASLRARPLARRANQGGAQLP